MSTYVPNRSCMPPGFRFHPTDEELVGYYLKKKIASEQIEMDVIHEVDLYKLEPWDLKERCSSSSSDEQTEWYFFCHRDKKYLTGTRANRATIAGFWKATGRDKAIHNQLGMRKTLVFYKGRAPNGQRTNWIMHEYRLEEQSSTSTAQENEWVICHVFKKRMGHKDSDQQDLDSLYNMQATTFTNSDTKNCTKEVLCDCPFLCKQETELDQYTSSHQLSGLDNMECPDFSCKCSSSNTFNVNSKSIKSAKSTDSINLEAEDISVKPRLASSLQRPLQFLDNDLEAKWEIGDGLSSKRLGHRESSRDQRNDIGNINYSKGGSSLELQKKEHKLEFSLPYEVDLWNFEN